MVMISVQLESPNPGVRCQTKGLEPWMPYSLRYLTQWWRPFHEHEIFDLPIYAVAEWDQSDSPSDEPAPTPVPCFSLVPLRTSSPKPLGYARYSSLPDSNPHPCRNSQKQVVHLYPSLVSQLTEHFFKSRNRFVNRPVCQTTRKASYQIHAKKMSIIDQAFPAVDRVGVASIVR